MNRLKKLQNKIQLLQDEAREIRKSKKHSYIAAFQDVFGSEFKFNNSSDFVSTISYDNKFLTSFSFGDLEPKEAAQKEFTETITRIEERVARWRELLIDNESFLAALKARVR